MEGDLLHSDLDKFYSDVVNNLVRDIHLKNPHKQNINILAYSHGSLISSHFQSLVDKNKVPIVGHPKNIKDILNTEIYRENFDYSGNTNRAYRNVEFEIFRPILMRKHIGNFEKANIDVCRTEGVKGIVNYPMFDAQNERQMIPVRSSGTSVLYQTDAYATPDVKFVLPQSYSKSGYFGAYPSADDYPEYYPPKGLPSVLEGGDNRYVKKYEKYKFKYLQLKQKAITR